MARHTAQQPVLATGEAASALEAILLDLGLPADRTHPRFHAAARTLRNVMDYQQELGKRAAHKTIVDRMNEGYESAMRDLGIDV